MSPLYICAFGFISDFRRLWYTSGKHKEGDEYFWEGDGTNVEGQTFWLDEAARALPGDTIVYGTYGDNILKLFHAIEITRLLSLKYNDHDC